MVEQLSSVNGCHKGKFLYFFLFVWYAAQGRFSSLFLEERGLKETEIGILLSLQSAVGLVVNPLGAFVADDLVRREYVFGRELVVVVLSILTTVTFSLHGIPEYYHREGSFIYFIIIRIIYAICLGPIYAVISGIVLKNLSDTGSSKEAFGQDRLFGAVSWAIVSVLLGVIMDHYRSTNTMYLALPIAEALLLVCICMVTSTIFVSTVTDAESKTIEMSGVNEERNCVTVTCDGDTNGLETPSEGLSETSPCNGVVPVSSCFGGLVEMIEVLGLFFSSSDRAMFTLLCVALSMGTSIIEDLVFLYFRNGLGASYTLCGISVVVTVIVEIPVFQYSRHLLDTFGRNGLLLIACFAYVTRVVGYTIVPNGWWVLLLEPLHGVTYGCICTASVDHAASIAPVGLESTAQAVMGSLQSGVGSLVGTSVGAFIEDNYGSHVLYRGAAAVVALNTVCFIAIWHLSSKTVGVSGNRKQVTPPCDKNDFITKYEKVALHDTDDI